MASTRSATDTFSLTSSGKACLVGSLQPLGDGCAAAGQVRKAQLEQQYNQRLPAIPAIPTPRGPPPAPMPGMFPPGPPFAQPQFYPPPAAMGGPPRGPGGPAMGGMYPQMVPRGIPQVRLLSHLLAGPFAHLLRLPPATTGICHACVFLIEMPGACRRVRTALCRCAHA